MATKIRIKDTNEEIELIRGVQIPREGETLVLTRRGEKEGRVYSIYLIEHFLDMNSRAPIGSTVITVEEINGDEDQLSEDIPEAVSPDFDGEE